MKWLKKAAAGGDEKAQLRLAETYEGRELDLLTDEVEALGWHLKAAGGVDKYAQCRLGRVYKNGK